MPETEQWPVIKARWFGEKRTRTDLIVIHDMEFPERITAAEDVAHYFATTNIKASAHICVDSDSIIQCVMDSYEAWAAPPVNDRAIHIELAGFAAQTPSQWRDKYSIALLAIGADAVAQYCLKYNLPSMKLSDAQLRNNMRGIVSHDQVSRVFKKSDHHDPGPNFPWSRFMLYVKAAILDRQPGPEVKP